MEGDAGAGRLNPNPYPARPRIPKRRGAALPTGTPVSEQTTELLRQRNSRGLLT
jgi:hypothetical protein